MQSLTQPILLLKPFAESGDKNSIPVTNTDASNPQLADLTNGFPAITSEDPDDTGLPPERKDFNGLGYLTTTYDYFYQAGGTFTFNSTISTAIGGYPLNARLWYTDGNGGTVVLRSTKGNNTDNFVTTPSYIGTSWVAETPSLTWDNAWTGTNTFTGNIIKKLDAVLGTTPSALKSADFGVHDANGNWLGGWELHYNTDGSIVKQMAQRKPDGSENYAIFGIGYNSSQQEQVIASNGVQKALARFSVPNYSTASGTNLGTITSGHTYTAPQDGTLHFQATGGYPEASIAVIRSGFDDLVISRVKNRESASDQAIVVWAYVRKGETYRLTGHGNLYAFFCALGN